MTLPSTQADQDGVKGLVIGLPVLASSTSYAISGRGLKHSRPTAIDRHIFLALAASPPLPDGRLVVEPGEVVIAGPPVASVAPVMADAVRAAVVDKAHSWEDVVSNGYTTDILPTQGSDVNRQSSEIADSPCIATGARPGGLPRS